MIEILRERTRKVQRAIIVIPTALRNVPWGGASMKKSNWLIIGILVVASIIFLAMWYALGFNLVDDPLDLVVSIVWWVVIVAVCLLINWSEQKRRRALRTSFIAPGLIYNPEAGIVRIEGEQSYTPTLERMLDSLAYDFDHEEVSNDQRIRFTYIVRSDKFSDNGDTWEGEVVKITDPDNIRYFQNRGELARLIDAV